MNYIIPPGARRSTAAVSNAYMEAVRYDEPETLQEKIDRERKENVERAKIEAIFSKLDKD